MNMKHGFIVLILLSGFSAFAAPYNREKCDTKIKVEQYIHKGSIADERAAGKTYNFEKIVSDMQNELTGKTSVGEEYFDCLNNLSEKASAEATEYWGTRIANSKCMTDKGDVPSVKPEGCDEETFLEYGRSMRLINESDLALAELKKQCTEKNGKKSCDPAGSLQGLNDAIKPLVSKNSDECCDMKDGRAYKVLRGFYTVEFGNMPDAALQKECYKRTRANTSANDYISSCIKSVAKGIAESVMKMYSAAKSISNMGSLSEIWRVISTPDILMKIGQFIAAIFDQMFNQVASFGCFTGEYRTAHACKLVSSMAMDYFTGAKLVQGIKFLALAARTAPGQMSALAKQFLDANPGAKAAVTKSMDQATSAGAKVKPKSYKAGFAAGATTAKYAAKIKSLNVGARSLEYARNLRAKAGKAIGGDRVEVKPTLNSSRSVTQQIAVSDAEKIALRGAMDKLNPPGPSPTSVLSAAEKQALNETFSSGAGTVAKPVSLKVAKVMRSEVEPFVGSHTKGRTLVGNADLAGKSAADKVKLLTEAADAKKAAAKKLLDGKNGVLNDAQYARVIKNVDEALAAQTRGLVDDAVSTTGQRISLSQAQGLRDQVQSFVNPGKAGRTLVDDAVLKGKSKPDQLRLLNAAADEKRAAAKTLLETKSAKSLTNTQYNQAIANIDSTLAAQTKKLRLVDEAAKATATKAATGTAETAAVNSTAGAVSSSSAGSAATALVNQVDDAASIAARSAIDTSIPSVGIGAGNTTAVIGSTATRTTAQVLDSIPKVDFSSVVSSSAKVTSATQKTIKDLSVYMQRTQTATASSAKSTVYGNKNRWGTSIESLRQHDNVRKLVEKGVIDKDKAESLHNIIATTEKMARGNATVYNTSYITAPNANPGTFKKLGQAAVNTVGGTVAGKASLRSGLLAPTTNSQIESFSDARTNPYDKDTLTNARETVTALQASPQAVKKSFEGLKTEEKILDQADRLRVKVKTFEMNYVNPTDTDLKNSVSELLEKINAERDLALVNIDAKPAADKPADTAVTAPIPPKPRQPAQKAKPKEAPAESAASVAPPKEDSNTAVLGGGGSKPDQEAEQTQESPPTEERVLGR